MENSESTGKSPSPVPDDTCIIRVQCSRRTGFLGRLSRLHRARKTETASLFPHGVEISDDAGSRSIRLCDIDDVQMREILTFAEIRIRHPGGVTILGGMTAIAAAAFERELKNARKRWWLSLHQEPNEVIDGIRCALFQLKEPTQFVRKQLIRNLAGDIGSIVGSIGGSWPAEFSNAPGVQQLQLMRRFHKDPDGERTRANEAYIVREIAAHRELFDGIESHPLTDEQRRAVVADEARNLVVASAGSGKTSVIVAKAAWLVRSRRRPPSELLLLAFAREASEEMAERLRSRLGAEVGGSIAVRTFHSLGMSIIGDAEGARPSLSRSAEDVRALQSTIDRIVQELLISDEELSLRIRKWFQDHFAPYRNEHDFKNMGEYWDYIRHHDIRSLKGDKVKSFEECEISNFLYFNGVPYEYEADYEVDTATPQKRRYRPDFRIAGTSIYIEHFGIDARGNTAPHVDREKYLEDRKWKKKTHADNGTILIETFSHERTAGSLLRNLERSLLANGILLSPVSNETMFGALQRQGRLNRFSSMVSTFLTHFKGSGMSMADLERRVSEQGERAVAFVEVFRPVYTRYQAMLSERGEIDFNDMINRATEHVEEGRFSSPYGYILVDEFQDISASRARLLRALLQTSPDAQLFAVGDDWQSIYRFGGADISLMKGFECNFGDCERTDLETTFRCSEGIVRVATKLVLQNPSQIRKKVRATRTSSGPAVHIGYPGKGGRSPLLDAISLVSEDASRHDGALDVLILGRYRHLRPDGLSEWRRNYPGLRFSYKTIHGSKGLEADYAIVVGLSSGEFGFPSEITDDPLYDLVLAESEAHPNAEERRLLYVALTRARRMVFLLADGGSPSLFAEELSSGYPGVGKFGSLPDRVVSCPDCGKGRLRQRLGKRGSVFFGCSNWPYCSYTMRVCPNCSKGLLVKSEGRHVCQECGSAFKACPECGGFLRERIGRYGRFLGCINFPACSYTDNIPHGKQRNPKPTG